MLTIVETPTFSALWPDYWSEEELGEFCFWLALRPDAGVKAKARARVYA